jgi:hypothetical protein
MVAPEAGGVLPAAGWAVRVVVLDELMQRLLEVSGPVIKR